MFKIYNLTQTSYSIMGGCVSSPSIVEHKNKQAIQFKTKFFQILVPIKLSIGDLADQWPKEELNIIKDQIQSACPPKIQYEQFVRMFPSLLQCYSDIAVKNLFALFSDDKDTMTRGDLLDGLILFHQGNKEVMRRTIFWIYTQADPKKSLQKRKMSKQLLKCFIDDNRDFHYQNASSKSMKDQLFKSDFIEYPTFTKLFSLYDYKKMKQLVQWKQLGIQNQLAHIISKNSPIIRKTGDPVYVVEYQWFLAWKNYMEARYKVEIIVQDQKQMTLSHFQQRSTLKKKYSKTENTEKKNQQNPVRPLEIRNKSLQGFYPNELRRSLIQFRDYVLLPEYLWKMLEGIYRGGPVYKRKFPQIYCLSIIQVYVDKEAKFIRQKINDDIHVQIGSKGKFKSLKKILQEDENMVQLKSQFKKGSFVCYLKNSGKENWLLIKDLSKDIVEYLSHHRTYICFVHDEQMRQFQTTYNCQTFGNSRVIKNRIENYGANLRIVVDNIMMKGRVIGLIDSEYVIIEVQDREGNYQRRRIQIEELRKHNSYQLPIEPTVQSLSGMENLGNTCYMNTVVQCLIRTPLLGDFLAKQNCQRQQQQQHILDMIYQIFQRSRSSNEVIQTSRFKRTVQNYFPFFKGFSQQDAQEFLICVLSKISDELKERPNSLIKSRVKQSKIKVKNSSNEVQESSQFYVKNNPPEGSKIEKGKHLLGNSKIIPSGPSRISIPEGSHNNYSIKEDQNRRIRFFSGTSEVETICTLCNKTNSRNVESFFTYSLGLPQHKNKQFYFTFIPKTSGRSVPYKSSGKFSCQPVRYGITLPNNITLGEAQEGMAKVIGIPAHKLFFAPVFNGQWMRGFSDQDLFKEMNFFANYNMTLVCYEIDYQDVQRYGDFNRKDLSRKSIKVEVRHRYYNKKNQTFQAFFTPLLIQVDQTSKWQQMENDLEWVIDNFIDKAYLRDQSLAKTNKRVSENAKQEMEGRNRKQSYAGQAPQGQVSNERKQSSADQKFDYIYKEKNISEVKMNKRSESGTAKVLQVPSFEERNEWKKSMISENSATDELLQKKDSREFESASNVRIPSKKQQKVDEQVLIGSKPYRIRLISKSLYSEDCCLICREKFDTNTGKQKGFFKKSFFTRAPCLGCTFQTNRPLFEDNEARYRAENAIIVIDWEDHYAFKISNKFHSSHNEAKQRTAQRVDKLQHIIANNIKFEELIEMRCDQIGCAGKQTRRIQRLKTYPNILILHLKRFRYDINCLVKLTNSIQYPTDLNIQGHKYQLYGVIVHNGDGMSGHYYCYVMHQGKWFKCDDQKVTLAAGKQYFDPKAYILFYKKSDFEASLINLSF